MRPESSELLETRVSGSAAYALSNSRVPELGEAVTNPVKLPAKFEKTGPGLLLT